MFNSLIYFKNGKQQKYLYIYQKLSHKKICAKIYGIYAYERTLGILAHTLEYVLTNNV